MPSASARRSRSAPARISASPVYHSARASFSPKSASPRRSRSAPTTKANYNKVVTALNYKRNTPAEQKLVRKTLKLSQIPKSNEAAKALFITIALSSLPRTSALPAFLGPAAFVGLLWDTCRRLLNLLYSKPEVNLIWVLTSLAFAGIYASLRKSHMEHTTKRLEFAQKNRMMNLLERTLIERLPAARQQMMNPNAPALPPVIRNAPQIEMLPSVRRNSNAALLAALPNRPRSLVRRR